MEEDGNDKHPSLSCPGLIGPAPDLIGWHPGLLDSRFCGNDKKGGAVMTKKKRTEMTRRRRNDEQRN